MQDPFHNEDPISSLDELAHTIAPLGAVWYRGHADASWLLVPSLFRSGFVGDPVQCESSMRSLFRAKAPSRHHECPGEKQLAEWMLLMQHYGIPTRILDWTASPLSALYFALSKPELDDQDGALVVLQPSNMNSHTTREAGVRALPDPFVIGIAEISYGHPYNGPPVVAVHPPEIDRRVSAQASAVTFHATARPLEDIHDDFRRQAPDYFFLRKHIIPSAAKKKLRRAVEALGIDQSTVFPDLHHLASEVVRVVRDMDAFTSQPPGKPRA